MTNTALQNSGVALPRGHELLWYEIDSVLGHGGFGITYLAHDKNLGRDVALKEYLPRSWADREPDFGVVPLDDDNREMYEKGLTRFMAEARTLARFKHPNIVQVLAVFEQHNTAYMAMEYEQGGSLSDLLRSGKFKVTQESLLRVLLPISDGLQAVHDLGFLHRDIKPANIYLREDGSPVLIDFGSSRETGILNTSDVTVLITQGYAPAEQYSKGFGEQGPWTDIYSLAASIYHTISGKVVVDALQRNAAVQSGSGDPFNPLSTMQLTGYTPEFKHAIDMALELKPTNRPQSLAAWREQLEASSGTEDVTMLRTPPTQTGRTTRHPEQNARTQNQPQARNHTDDDAVTQFIPAQPAAEAHNDNQPSAATNSQSGPSSAGGGSARYALIGVAALALIGAGAYFALRGDDAETQSTDAPEVSSNEVATATNNADGPASGEVATIDNDANEPETSLTNPADANGENKQSSADNTDNPASKPDTGATTDTTEKVTAPEEPVSIVAGLPTPNTALELNSPLETIADEIQVLTTALNANKQALQINSENQQATAAIERIGAKFNMLANTPIVKANGKFSNAVAEGLVMSVGVNAENQATVAALVQNSSTINEDYLRGLLTSSTLSLEEREMLIFGVASSPETVRTSLQSSSEYSTLISGFKDSIVAEIELRNFALAARMTSIALMLQPDDKDLQLLGSHLTLAR